MLIGRYFMNTRSLLFVFCFFVFFDPSLFSNDFAQKWVRMNARGRGRFLIVHAIDRNNAFIGYSEQREREETKSVLSVGGLKSPLVDERDRARKRGRGRVINRQKKVLKNLKPCKDFDEENCPKWSLLNECILNEKFMLSKCRKSCQKCAETFVRMESSRVDFPQVFFDFEVDGSERFLGVNDDDDVDNSRVVFELFNDTHPLTSENFRRLSVVQDDDGGDESIGRYRNARFHRIINGFMNQAGSSTKSGSIYGARFNDENINSRYHDSRYQLAMANGGPNTNADQFYISVNPQPHLDGKHVVFGRVIRGERVIEYVNERCGSENGKPSCVALVKNCGELV